MTRYARSALIGLLISTQAFAGLPPTTMKGQADSGKSVTFNLQVPKKQATRVNGTTALIETGNQNMVANPGIESGSTSGYSLGNVSIDATTKLPSGAPTFGSGSSVNLSIAHSSTTPISGSYDLNYVSSSATTAGDFVATDAFTVDPEGRGKVLEFKVSYEAVSNGSNANWSGTSSNSFGLAVYDVTNSAWLSCAGHFNFVQISGVGQAKATCQTATTTASARVVVYNANATSGAITLALDSFSFGPQITAQGAAISDWVSYTPTFTGFGTVSNVAVQSRRVGDSLEVHGLFQCGTATAVTAQVSLGYNGANNNVTVDSSKITYATQVGAASQSNAASTFYGISVLAGNSVNNLYFGVQQSTTGASSPTTANNICGSGIFFTFFARVPIVGWSSNTAMSSDTDTRVVTARQSRSSTQSIANSTSTTVAFNSTTFDKTGLVYTNGLFKANVTGTYEAKAVVAFAANATGVRQIDLYKNGSTLVSTLERKNAVSGGEDTYVQGSDTVELLAGETLEIQAFQNSGGALNVGSGGSPYNYFKVTRISGPATIAASEKIKARYVSTASTSFATGSNVIVQYDTKQTDTHNAVTTGASWKFTAPRSDTYHVCASVGVAANASVYVQMGNIYKNGSQYALLQYYKYTYVADTTSTGGCTDVDMSAGDYIDYRYFQNSAGARTQDPTAGTNWISITSVGGI